MGIDVEVVAELFVDLDGGIQIILHVEERALAAVNHGRGKSETATQQQCRCRLEMKIVVVTSQMFMEEVCPQRCP